MFSSGGVEPSGAIAGNDNDQDGTRFEPHYREIRSPVEVQIYEAILGTPNQGKSRPGCYQRCRISRTTGSCRGDSTSARRPLTSPCTAMRASDPDFAAGEDRVRYSVDTAGARGPFTVRRAQLWYQSIAYRWARNLDGLQCGRAAAIRGLLRPGGCGVGADADANGAHRGAVNRLPARVSTQVEAWLVEVTRFAGQRIEPICRNCVVTGPAPAKSQNLPRDFSMSPSGTLDGLRGSAFYRQSPTR